MQEYLSDGDRNVNVSKVIFKARGKTLDIKIQKDGNITILSAVDVK